MTENIRKKIEERISKMKKYEYKDQMQQLHHLRRTLLMEMDRRIESARKKRNFARETVAKKLQLQKYHKTFFAICKQLTFKKLVSLPFIYGMIIPAVILHIGIEIYHQISFRLYKIPLVACRPYFIFDRVHLSYLNWFEKFNCAYCSYFNGLMGYATEIAARTERFWCPIKHARRRAQAHGHYDDFFDYLDGEKYRKELEEFRSFKSEDLTPRQ